jgi:hypothetical protein
VNDRLFEESNEERIARRRRRFETGVERAESAHKKAVETVAAKAEAVDAAKQALEDFDRAFNRVVSFLRTVAGKSAFAEKDRELKLVDDRLRQALRVRGVDPGTGEVEGS